MIFNKRGLMDDWFDLMAFSIIAVLAFSFIYLALVNGVEQQNDAVIEKAQDTRQFMNEIIEQRDVYNQQEEPGISALKQRVIPFSVLVVPGVIEYSEEELQQLREQARRERGLREAVKEHGKRLD